MIAESQPLGVAALLRDTRVKLGRDIAVAASTLRIRQPYLQAIEEGRYHDLPGAAYAVGFVRGYADYLGLDGNEIVRRFKQENNDLSARAELSFPTTGSGSGIPTGALLLIALVGSAIAYGVWYWLQDRHEQAVEAVPALPERLASMIQRPPAEPPLSPTASPATSSESIATPVTPLGATPAAAPEPAAPPPIAEPAPMAEAPKPGESKPTEKNMFKPMRPSIVSGDNPSLAATPTPSTDTPVAGADTPPQPKPVWHTSKRLLIRAEDTCWIKIRDKDGKVVISRLLHKGDSFAPPDAPGLEMTVGNAAALTLLIDGREAPSLGPAGMVKHIILDPARLSGGAPAPAETPTGSTQE